MVKKFRRYLCRFGATHERDRRTDRQTDRRTPHTGNSRAMHSIARQKSINLIADLRPDGRIANEMQVK